MSACGSGRRSGQLRHMVREVKPDCAIDLVTNSYSVPWRLIEESVQVVPAVVVRHVGEVVADHALCRGRRQRSYQERAPCVVGAAAPLRPGSLAATGRI